MRQLFCRAGCNSVVLCIPHNPGTQDHRSMQPSSPGKPIPHSSSNSLRTAQSIHAPRAQDINLQPMRAAFMRGAPILPAALTSPSWENHQLFTSTVPCGTSTAGLPDPRSSDTSTDIKNCLEIKKGACSRDHTLSQTAASVDAWEMKRAFATDVRPL